MSLLVNVVFRLGRLIADPYARGETSWIYPYLHLQLGTGDALFPVCGVVVHVRAQAPDHAEREIDSPAPAADAPLSDERELLPVETQSGTRHLAG